MEILPGRMNILIGMNGEGKTTLFDILAGLIDTDAQIEHPVPAHEVLYQIQGVPVLSTIRGKDLAELILCSSGQYGHKDLSPCLFSGELGHDEDALGKITYIWNTQYGKMSPGERRWFTILLYCLLDKQLYLFDEPTAGVDPYSAQQIIAGIRHLQERKGKTVLYTTHRIEDLRYFPCYQIHVLHHGKIVLSAGEQDWVSESRGKNMPFLNNLVDSLPHAEEKYGD
jgi:ABC-2 type transport system ATP-binding protein